MKREDNIHHIITECLNNVLNEKKGEIKINPKNKGKFNATKKRTGKSTAELTHSKNPLTRKRAIFAQNVKKWRHGNSSNESIIRKAVNESLGRLILESFDPDMDVIVVGGRQAGEYKAGELGRYFELNGTFEPDAYSLERWFKNSPIVGYPKLVGYLGPMWDGNRIRYESQEVYNALSI